MLVLNAGNVRVVLRNERNDLYGKEREENFESE
jgi:hypothetical protein